jgi:hypothetical protein
VVCCIKKFRATAAESCGATASEVAEVLNGTRVLNEAIQEATAGDDDFANNASLPEWKRQCIKDYVSCKQQGWAGNCYDCLRYCEGQRAWPDDRCHPQ